MNILICEPEYPTHYHFIQYLLPLFSKYFDQVVVAVSASADTNVHYLSTIKPLESLAGITCLKVFKEPSLLPHEKGFKDQEESMRIENFKKIGAIIDDFSIQHIIALTGDKLIPLIEMSRSGNTDSPWHHVDYHLGVHWLVPVPDGINNIQLHKPTGSHETKNRGLQAQLKKIQSLININPESVLVQNFLAYKEMKEHHKHLANSWVHTPVPIEVHTPVTKIEARLNLGLPINGQLIGFSGSIQRRKGIKVFLQALKQDGIPADARFLLIGPFEDEITSIISTNFQSLVKSGKLLVRNQVLDSYTQHLAISSFDVVICSLLEHKWSSDIALRAIVAERPILASDGEWFRYMVDQFKLGMTISSTCNPKSVAEAISNSLFDFSDYQPAVETKQIIDFNHPGNYASIVLEAILGQNPSSARNVLVKWPNPHAKPQN